MISTRFKYLRPGSLFREFVVESNTQAVTSTGRVANSHSGDGSAVLKGCLADASDSDRENHSVDGHVVTHAIVQAGRPKAKRTDRLILGERAFYVVDIDDCGTLGLATIYYAEERRDAR